MLLHKYINKAENARKMNEMHNAIKEGGSTRILGHLMWVSVLNIILPDYNF